MDFEARQRSMERILTAHEDWRRQCANLIASENATSDQVRALLNSDLSHRYGDYLGRDLSKRKYFGNTYIKELEKEVTDLASELFRASEIELRTISGHVAGICVLMGLLNPGDVVLEVGGDGGGHRLAAKFAESPLIDLDVQFLPFDGARYNIDLERLNTVIHARRPRMVILGSSNFLFPHPVREIKSMLSGIPSAILAYDASHVMGLVAAGRFQDPLREGADIVFGSTHKTLPGPQGGIIFSDNKDLMERVSAAVYPAVVTNHHLARLPSLGMAFLEMLSFGGEYADAIVRNAEALAESLEKHGVEAVSYEGRHTESHTILVKVSPYGNGSDVAAYLEQCGIIVTNAKLPVQHGIEGLRVGVQEVTRFGADEECMSALGALMAEGIRKTKSPLEIQSEVRVMVSRWNKLRFC